MSNFINRTIMMQFANKNQQSDSDIANIDIGGILIFLIIVRLTSFSAPNPSGLSDCPLFFRGFPLPINKMLSGLAGLKGPRPWQTIRIHRHTSIERASSSTDKCHFLPENLTSVGVVYGFGII